jgi:hypothetical protein
MASNFGLKGNQTRRKPRVSFSSAPKSKRVSVPTKIKKPTISYFHGLDQSPIGGDNEVPIINPIYEYPRTSFVTAPTSIPSNFAPASIL